MIARPVRKCLFYKIYNRNTIIVDAVIAPSMSVDLTANTSASVKHNQVVAAPFYFLSHSGKAGIFWRGFYHPYKIKRFWLVSNTTRNSTEASPPVSLRWKYADLITLSYTYIFFFKLLFLMYEYVRAWIDGLMDGWMDRWLNE